jgi:GxxExxY protein
VELFCHIGHIVHIGKTHRMIITKRYINQLIFIIIGCAIEVYRVLGPGLLESIYEKCLIYELQKKGLKCESQCIIPITYKEIQLEGVLRFDILVEDLILVEVKSTDGISPIFKATLLSYMEQLKKPKGIIINFNCMNIFREGQVTLVNKYFATLPD